MEVRDVIQGQSPARWLEQVLGWSIRPEDPGRPEGRRAWALPSGARARVVVPAGKAGRGAFGSFNDSMSQFARVRKAAYGTCLSLGWAPGAQRVTLDMHEQDEDSLVSLIRGVAGADVALGVTAGPDLRPNRKPVLQLVDGDGRIAAFAKVGWNDHTRALVDAEAHALVHLADVRRSFAIPSPLYHGSWQGRRVLVVSAGPRTLVRRCRRNAPPPVAAEADVAASGHRRQEPFDTSAYLGDLRRRIEAPGTEPATATRLRAIVERVAERCGGAEMAFGAWHGDWAPWNMIRSRNGLFVVDWERYGGPVPVGFDHLHLRFQVAHQAGGRPLGEAAGAAVTSLRSAGPALSIDPAQANDVLSLYLAERVLRIETGNAAGMAVRSALVPDILTHLEGMER